MSNTIAIGSRRELFVDSLLIDKLKNAANSHTRRIPILVRDNCIHWNAPTGMHLLRSLQCAGQG